MARKPTGNPRGRPRGSGYLTPGSVAEDAQARVTIRLPLALYERLEAFAAGRHFHRSSPQLARCIRDAVEEYLERHSTRQPENMQRRGEKNNRQPQTTPAISPPPALPDGENNRQPQNAPSATLEASARKIGDDNRQPEKTHQAPQERHGDDNRQPETALPPFDTTRYALGELCVHRHAYHGSGQSLRRLSDRECLECHAARMRAYRQRRSQRATPTR